MASSKPQSPTVLEELFSAADDVLGDFCDEIVSLAESLLPQLQRYLAWEVDSFGPMVPEWCPASVSTPEVATSSRSCATMPVAAVSLLGLKIQASSSSPAA
ncbi:hypothetical protein Gpo141_00007361 [Globisporangium polare]